MHREKAAKSNEVYHRQIGHEYINDDHLLGMVLLNRIYITKYEKLSDIIMVIRVGSGKKEVGWKAERHAS